MVVSTVADEGGSRPHYKEMIVDDLKRDAENTVKKAWRRADGTEDLDDKVANLGDDLRKNVEDAGDETRETADDIGDKAADVADDTRRTAGDVGNTVRREVNELGEELSEMDKPGRGGR